MTPVCSPIGSAPAYPRSYARPHAHAYIDPAEIFGGGGDRISEREKLIWVAQNVERKLRNFLGHKFWARVASSTVEWDEETIRAYTRNREMADKQLDQMQLKLASS
jgi:hypothetical protein